MCYGNLDPKLMMREMDARLKSVTYDQDTSNQAEPKPRAGLFAPLRAAFAWVLRKGPRHV